MEFLRDPIWQFVGALLGLITIVLTWIAFRVQTQRKSLSYEIITNTALLGETTKKKLGESIRISYKNKKIGNPRLVEFRILNSGNSTILSSDFETPIRITFQNPSQIIDADIVSTKPSNIEPRIEHGNNYILVKPILLNKGDEIHLKALVNNPSSDIDFSGRIAGVREIKSLGTQNSVFSLWTYLFGTYILGGVAGAQAGSFLVLSWGFPELAPFFYVFPLFLATAATVVAFAGILMIASRVQKGMFTR